MMILVATTFSGAVLCQLKAFILPALDTSDHFLNAATKFRKVESRPIGPVTVRAIAINYEECVFGIGVEIPRRDASVREINCAGNMSSGIRLRGADV